MKQKKHTTEEIIRIIQEADAGKYPVDGNTGFYSSQPRYFYDCAAKKIITL